MSTSQLKFGSGQDQPSALSFKGRDGSMSRLQTLPVELALYILRYLPIQSLRTVQLLSRYWYNLFVTNTFTIYHNAAIYHRFVSSPSISLSDATKTRGSRYLKDAKDWRTFCEC